MAGDRALDQQELVLVVHADHLEVAHGDAVGAHVAGHALAGEHAAGRLALPDRADVPVVPVLHYFKGVEVPRGKWGLRLRYRERMWPVLWLVSVTGFALLVLGPALLFRGAPRAA